jgi:RNA polymerase sigma-70 factor (ECF subfamily)
VTAADGLSDADLARRAAAGDDRAYAQLVSRHKDGLHRLLRGYLGDAEEAREAAQEAFIAAWSALGRYDPARPFGAWLRTIAVNKARDRGRRRAFRRLIFGDRPPEETDARHRPDPAATPDEALIHRERLALLDRAVASLPDALKAPLLLTAIEGRSQQETADILGVSAKAVETRVYRARRLLAEALRPEPQPNPRNSGDRS